VKSAPSTSDVSGRKQHLPIISVLSKAFAQIFSSIVIALSLLTRLTSSQTKSEAILAYKKAGGSEATSKCQQQAVSSEFIV
jgi:hypothetical protein